MITGDATRDNARAVLVDVLVAQNKLAEADQIVGGFVAAGGNDATFARALLALHHGKPATADRHALDSALAAMKPRGTPYDRAILELWIARLAVAAGEPGARKRLASIADDLRAKNLGGFAVLADREAAH